MKEIYLTTKDNIKIAANHYSNGFEYVIVICPGFLMSKDSKPFSILAKRLSETSDVIVMDFRGHGKSGGRYTFTSYENLDLKTVLDYATSRYKSVGIIGFSLGAAIAINEVAQHKAIDRLMVVSAPTEFKKIENRFLNKEVISSTIKKFEWQMGKTRLGNILLKKINPIESIDKISPIPILFVHGKKDAIVDPSHSQLLYKKAKEPKRLVIFDDCLHAEDVFFGDNFDSFVSLCSGFFKLNKKADEKNLLQRTHQ